jgi:hypothetical protein
MEVLIMRRIGSTVTLIGIVVLLVAAGCQQQRIAMNRLAQKTERPPELARLDVLIGDWSNDTELTMTNSDEAANDKCEISYSWAADQWVLIEHFEYGEGDKRVAGVAFWSWDHEDELYRITWFYNSGARADGTASYMELPGPVVFMPTKTSRPDIDEDMRAVAHIWFVTAKTNNPYTNVKTRRSGGMTLVDDTLGLAWTEWLPGPFGGLLSELNIGSLESTVRRK